MGACATLLISSKRCIIQVNSALTSLIKENLSQNRNLKWIDCCRIHITLTGCQWIGQAWHRPKAWFICSRSPTGVSDIQIWAKMQHRQSLGQELALRLWAQLELHKYSLCIKPTLELHGTVATLWCQWTRFSITRFKTLKFKVHFTHSQGQPSPSCPWGAKRCPTWQRLWFEPWLHPSDQRDDPAENDSF